MTDVYRILRALSHIPRWSIQCVVRVLVGIAFWTGVTLPLLYIPLILLGGPLGVGPVDVVALLGLNYLSLLVGARHRGPPGGVGPPGSVARRPAEDEPATSD